MNATASRDADPRVESAIPSCGISAVEAATLLGISESHFYNLRKTGRLGPDPKRLGRSRRYDRQELLDWWRSGCPTRERWQAIRGVRR